MSTLKHEHTPTPWSSEVPPSSSLTTRQIIGPNREPVAFVGLPYGHSCGTFADVANSELIVRAVNSHEELVAALVKAEFALTVLATASNGNSALAARYEAEVRDIASKDLSAVRAALAKAKE